MQNIRSLGVRCQVSHLHVLDHALPKEGDRKLLREWNGCTCSHPRLSQTEPLRGPNTQPTAETIPLPTVLALMPPPTAKRFSPMGLYAACARDVARSSRYKMLLWPLRGRRYGDCLLPPSAAAFRLALPSLPAPFWR
jgi:hypothetical protein